MEADYYAAMGCIDLRLELVEENEPAAKAVKETERRQLLTLAERLFALELGYEKRIEIAAQMRELLNGRQTDQIDWIPPPVPVLAEAEIS